MAAHALIAVASKWVGVLHYYCCQSWPIHFDYLMLSVIERFIVAGVYSRPVLQEESLGLWKCTPLKKKKIQIFAELWTSKTLISVMLFLDVSTGFSNWLIMAALVPQSSSLPMLQSWGSALDLPRWPYSSTLLLWEVHYRTSDQLWLDGMLWRWKERLRFFTPFLISSTVPPTAVTYEHWLVWLGARRSGGSAL